MNVLNLLLGNSDRGMNNLIEAMVRDTFYDRAVVECTRTARLDDFARRGRFAWLNLIIVAPDGFVGAPGQPVPRGSIEPVVRAIQDIRVQRPTPIIAYAVSPEHQLALLEAGAESALGLPLDSNALRSEVRRVLGVEEPVEVSRSNRWSLGRVLLRGMQQLRQA